MSRSERLIAIMQSLRNRRGAVTAAALADEFGISERTVYRDIASLVSRGAVIAGEAGFGYIVKPSHFLPPLMLERDEADAIVLGLRYVMRRGDPALARAARSSLTKLADVLPTGMDDHVRHSGLVVAPPAVATSELVGRVRQALSRGVKLRLAYADREARRTDRTVWPAALGFFDGCEVLAAWCEMREGFRHFRLDRIIECEELGESPPRPQRTLLAEYRRLEPHVQG